MYYIRILLKNIFSLKGLSALLSSFGALWLCVEIANYFFQDPNIPDAIKKLWWLFFVAGLLIAAWICRPILRVGAKLKDRDIEIEIVIGNLFSFSGAIIVGSNTTFDTRISKDLISEKSVQGQFTKLYYGGSETQLDAELNEALKGIPFETLSDGRNGKKVRYPIGTVVRVNPKERTGYFVAIAHLNKHGNAQGTFEGLKEALSELWVFIGHRGTKESLITPVLGTGFTRLVPPREVIVQEMIKSFIAACSERTFCDKLTIVIAASDAIKNQISLASLGNYLAHVCMYTEFAANNGERTGNPVQ